MNEFQKSIRAILYERIVSPLSGTLFISWLVWNWKLLYYFFIFDTGQKVIDKILYIEGNFSDWKILILYPILSSVFFIVVYPFISTGAYWVYLKFKEWQNRIKNSIEKHRLLTIEQSIELRIEIKEQQDRFLELESKKDSEIALLKSENKQLISELSKRNSNLKDDNKTEVDTKNESLYINPNDTDLVSFISSENSNYFEEVAKYINNGWQIDSNDVPYKVLTSFIAFGLIEKEADNGYFEFTEKGKIYLKEYLKKQIDILNTSPNNAS